MTDNSAVVLRGREPVAMVRREPSQDAQIERARLYSQASGFVPSAFAGKPGACLLAMDWAAKNGLDDLTALQGLHIIDGKPSVSAALRVDLATKAGFEFRVLASNAEQCSLDVYDRRGGTTKLNPEPVSITIGEIPSYRFKKTSNGKDSNWTLYPADMLFAHACRVADRRYVKTAAALIDARQDYDEWEQSPLELLPAAEPESDASASVSPAEAEAPSPDLPSPSGDGEPPSKTAVMNKLGAKSIKPATALIAIRDRHPEVNTLDDLFDDPTGKPMLHLLDWIDAQ